MQKLLPLLLFLFTAQASASELEKRSETTTRMASITHALDAYALTYGRIPCPASATLALSSATFGKELINGINCDGATSGNITAGAVPVRSLSLPDSFMFDGWGRRITYVIDQRFAGKGQFQQELTSAGVTYSSYYFTAKGDIILQDTISGTTLNSSADDRTLGILLSYGQNGKGAYTRQGTALSTTGSGSDEAENNAALDAIFIQKSASANFDDMVYAIKRNNVVPLHCLGVDVPSRTGGHTPIGPGYPAYDWPHSIAATPTAQQNCSAEYTGLVQRQCDANGQWQTIVSTCNCDSRTLTDGLTYSATWPKGDSAGTIIGDSLTLTETSNNACIAPSTGDVTAQCAASGGWTVTANNCTP